MRYKRHTVPGPVTIEVQRNGVKDFVIHDGSWGYGANVAYTWMMDMNLNETLQFDIVEGYLQSSKDSPVIFTAEFLVP